MRTRRRPDWLKTRPPSGRRFTDIKSTLRDRNLNTVCEETDRPSLGECWSGRNGPGTATFMLTGNRCSRRCNFCDVTTGGMKPPDSDEPANVTDAVTEIGPNYVVLTSVDHDDLSDQGAAHFVGTIHEIKHRDPEVLIEVLIPDFQDDPEHVQEIVDAGPDVIAHSIGTIERLQWPIRDRHAGYEQSLSVLQQMTDESDIHAKASVIPGFGKHTREVYQTLSNLRGADMDIVTFGQYLQPFRSHLDMLEYVHPDAFETWQCVVEDELGSLHCTSGPMVRLPYRAGELLVDALPRKGSGVKEVQQAAHAAAGQ